MKTLCLNMIVKNESKIIERALASVVNYIDCYCICDTGSDDNTMELITSFFEKHEKPGKIVQELFDNFEHNRNFAMKECYGMSDFILFIDADMIFKPRITKEQLSDLLEKFDYFQIAQGTEDFYYNNMRIVKNEPDSCKYNCYTHEYIDIPSTDKLLFIAKENIFILDIGDGGSKQDKFKRDIILCKRGIVEQPEHRVRYTFYLAESYYHDGQLENAIEAYKERINFGSWEQEVWYSYYKIWLAYQQLNKPEHAIFYFMDAYNILPNRFENIYQIVKYYRLQPKKYAICQMFLKDVLSKSVNGDLTNIQNTNIDHYLFLDKKVYSYLLYYEYTIIAFYLGIRNINKELVYILNSSNDNSINSQLLSNFIFYDNQIHPLATYDLSNSFVYNGRNFYSSSACIWKTESDNYAMNIRYVNYRIDELGRYLDCDDLIISINKYIEFNDLSIIPFSLEKEILFKLPQEFKRYVGIEDVRVYNGKYIGTGQFNCDGETIGLVYGDYSLSPDGLDNPKEIRLSGELLQFLGKESQPLCEKNWVFYEPNHIVYNWFPLILCNLSEQESESELISVKEMPKFFRFVRGSTCGVLYQNEIWFITHIVSNGSPRIYYHSFAVFDESMNLLRFSAPFKFSDVKIEYCLGFIIENGNIIISYSKYDKTTNIGVYNLDYIKSLLYAI
jgi:hypothetical protein